MVQYHISNTVLFIFIRRFIRGVLYRQLPIFQMLINVTSVIATEYDCTTWNYHSLSLVLYVEKSPKSLKRRIKISTNWKAINYVVAWADVAHELRKYSIKVTTYGRFIDKIVSLNVPTNKSYNLWYNFFPKINTFDIKKK